MHPEDKRKHFHWLYRLTHYYKIQTKTPGVVTRLILNPIQRILVRYLPFRTFFLVLKARQEGVSTLFFLWHLDATMFTPNTNTCILGQPRKPGQPLSDHQVRLRDGIAVSRLDIGVQTFVLSVEIAACRPLQAQAQQFRRLHL